MPKRFPLPTQARLHELFDYDRATGVVRAKVGRRSRRGAYKAGDVIGYPDASGYLKVTVDGCPYALHRVVWKWVTGDEPPEYIDHRNRVRHDNSWANLRAADKYENAANRTVRKPNGAKGVRPGATAGTWTAILTHRGRQHHLGTFSTEDDAVAAYRQKAKELRGEFGDEEPYVPAAVDVVQLVDGQFLDAAVNLVRRARGFALDKSVPPHVVEALGRVVTELGNEIARVAPDRFLAMARKSVTDIPS